MRLVVTRPQPDADRTAQALAALGHEPIVSPMLDIVLESSNPLPPLDFQAVLVTSSNAVRALAVHPERDRLLPLPLLAVGDRTALEARRAGFKNARSAGGAMDDLVALVRSYLHPGAGPLLYAAGDVQAGDLAQALGPEGFFVETIIVYRGKARLRLADDLAFALRAGSVDGVLVYSPRSAAALALALRAAGLAPLSERIVFFCLSQAVAEPLGRVARGLILIAARPDQISLFSLIERFQAERNAAPETG